MDELRKDVIFTDSELSYILELLEYVDYDVNIELHYQLRNKLRFDFNIKV